MLSIFSYKFLLIWISVYYLNIQILVIYTFSFTNIYLLFWYRQTLVIFISIYKILFIS